MHAARVSLTGPPTTSESIAQPLRIMPTVDWVLKPDAPPLAVAGVAKRSSALMRPSMRSMVSRQRSMVGALPLCSDAPMEDDARDVPERTSSSTTKPYMQPISGYS